jgi:hypothetical protein
VDPFLRNDCIRHRLVPQDPSRHMRHAYSPTDTKRPLSTSFPGICARDPLPHRV